MAAQRREKDKGRSSDQPSDAWLWPTALILGMGGWGQAMWIWDNVPPEGLVPLWLLLWVGVGTAGIVTGIHWFARRWALAGWLTMGAWAGVPEVTGLAQGNPAPILTDGQWLYDLSPLLLLSLLGLGLGGGLMTLAWLARRWWPGPAPRIRPLRQALWSGLFSVTCGWLLVSRAFALIPVALLAGALLLIETFFLTRESSSQ